MVEPAAWRILVALDATRHDAAALESATLLAARKQAEMLALFVEEQGLFHLAELPFAVELSHGGEQGRLLDAVRIERLLRSQIERLRQDLEQITRQQRIAISQRTVRGRYLAEALEAAETVNVLFLCRAAESCVDLGARDRRTHQAAGRVAVCVVYDGSSVAGRALHVAREIAEADNCPLTVLLPTQQEEWAQEWRRQAMATENLHQIASQFIVIGPDWRKGLAEEATPPHCRLLVIGRDDTPLPAALAGIAQCPLALVS